MLNAMLSLFRMILLILGGYEQVALENLALREQLAIFQRSVPHPKIRPTDRLFWVCLRKVWKEWKSALVIVRPATVLDWQRRRFRRYWSQLSRHTNPGRPRTNADIRKLVKTMAEANVGWGAPRIHGELLKLWESRFLNVRFPDSCRNGAPRRPRRGEPSSTITYATSCPSTSSPYRPLGCTCCLCSCYRQLSIERTMVSTDLE